LIIDLVMMRVAQQQKIPEVTSLIVCHRLVVPRPVWKCGTDVSDLDDEPVLPVNLAKYRLRATWAITEAAAQMGKRHRNWSGM
jgi:hypothetical protein